MNFKRLFILMLALIMASSAFSNVFATQSKIGDINSNGDIDSMDYVLLKRTYFGTYNLSDISIGDINGNGDIDSMDYVYLRRAYFGTYIIGGDNEPLCDHYYTRTVNVKTATCTENGYTGDLQCSQCLELLERGETTPKSTIHGETETVGFKEQTRKEDGYSGDRICKDCNQTIEKGVVIPKGTSFATYFDHFGNTATVPEGTSVFKQTLSQANLPEVSHENGVFYGERWDCRDSELRVFNLINEERANVGVAPLEWCEDAYYFAYVRAREQEQLWSHTRPNGNSFSQVFSEYNVIPMTCGENLFMISTPPIDCEKISVDSWVGSQGHYENMIREKYTSTVIAIYYSETTGNSYFVQLFFG